MPRTRPSLVWPLLIAAGLVGMTVVEAAAATRTWTGLGGNTLLSTPGNWENDTPPVDDDALIFPDTAPNTTLTNDIVGLRVLSITMRKKYDFNGFAIDIDSGGFSFEGPFLGATFNAHITLVASQQWSFTNSQNVTFTGQINLGVHTLTVNAQGASSTPALSNVISGAGSLTKIGTGVLLLTANNTYNGQTRASAGFLIALHSNAFGATDGTLAHGTIVEQTGSISVAAGVFDIPEALFFSGSNSPLVPQTMLSCLGPCLMSGPVTINGTTRLGRAVLTPGNPEMHFSQPLTGPGRVTFLHTGNVVLEASGSVLPGGVTVGRNIQPDASVTRLVLPPTSALNSSAGVLTLEDFPNQKAEVLVQGETQKVEGITGNGLVDLQFPSASLDLQGSGTYAYTGLFKGPGIVRMAGTGTLALTGNHANWAGTLKADAGLVTLTNGRLPILIDTFEGGRFEFREQAEVAGPIFAKGGSISVPAGIVGTAKLGITLGSGGTFVSGATANTQFNGILNVQGGVVLDGATLSLAWAPDFLAVLGMELPLIINDNADPVTGTFAGLPENTEIAIPNSILKVRIRYAGGDGNDVTLTVTQAFRDYLLSEGATSGFFTSEILIANSSIAAVDARLFFLRADGTTVTLDRSLAAKQRVTVRVNDVAGMSGTEFSTIVRSLTGRRLIVERTMTWDSDGYGAHTEHASDAPAAEWYFAEGSQGFFRTYLLLVNPHAAANQATVTYLREGEPPVTRQYPLGASARRTVDAGLDAALVGRSFGIKVVFDQPGMAERAMYFGESPLWIGGHEAAGTPALSTEWLLPEGATGSFFTTFILMANPNAAPADVTMTYLPQGGAPVVANKSIPANARLTVNIATESPALADAAVATQVHSTLPIVVERAQYWPGTPVQWYEAHSSLGVTAAAPAWGLAEGRVGGPRGYQTYILLANPQDVPVAVQITFLREAGAAFDKEFNLPAKSRFNVAVGPGLDVPELQDEAFGAFILAEAPIAVERALYWNVNGQLWSAGTNATAVMLQP